MRSALYITRVDLTNWMCFRGEHSLRDLPAAPIGISGIKDDDPERSNWAGKTALLEAIDWCLFDQHRKATVDELITTGESTMSVYVELSDGSSVERTKTIGQSVKVTYVDHAGVEHKQKVAPDAIHALLGMDWADYSQTARFEQGEVDAIARARSSERRQTLARWLELDRWDEARQPVAKQARKARIDLTVRQGQMERFVGLDDQPVGYLGSDLEAADQKVDAWRKALADAPQPDVEAMRERAVVWSAIAICRELEPQVKAARDALLKPLTDQDREQLADAVERAQVADQRYGAAKAEAEAARALVVDGFDGTCPVTCNACPVADTVREQRGAIADRSMTTAREMRTWAEEANAARLRLEELRTQHDRVARLVERYNQVAGRARHHLNVAKQWADGQGVLTEELACVDEWLDRVVARLKELEAGLDEMRTTRDSIHRQLAEAEREQAALLQKSRSDVALREERDRLVAEIKQLQRRAVVLALANRAVSPTGVPQDIARASLAALEQRGNAVLQGTGLAFTFAWGRQTKQPEVCCSVCGVEFNGKSEKACSECDAPRQMKRSDDLEIPVTDGTRPPEDIAFKSGGGKTLVSSAIRLSSAMMLRDRRGSQIAWCVVDEPFGQLDRQNSRMLAQQFAGLLGRLGFVQAFIVSHTPEHLDALPARIIVRKRGDDSSLELTS